MTNPHIGSSYDDFLVEEGIYDEVTAEAVKRVIAWQLEQRRRERGMSKAALAAEMHTSRTQVDRLLDPTNTKVQLDSLQRAARVLGRRLVVELE